MSVKHGTRVSEISINESTFTDDGNKQIIHCFKTVKQDELIYLFILH